MGTKYKNKNKISAHSVFEMHAIEYSNGRTYERPSERTNERANEPKFPYIQYSQSIPHSHKHTHTRIDVCISVRLLAQATISEIRNHNKLGLCH